MQIIDSISKLFPCYDAFLIDLWGVIHDGQELYPGVIGTLERLAQAGKAVVFLSNAPRRSAKAKLVLDRLGIPSSLYRDLLTSGEEGFRWLTEAPEMLPFPVHEPYYFLGPERDGDVLDASSYRSVPLKDASFILNVGYEDGVTDAGIYDAVLDEGAAYKLPMFCLNPDDIIVKLNGDSFPCAGLVAERYLARGQQVAYVGKPYPAVYTRGLELLGNPPKHRLLAIGDNFDTDILGGQQAGIDTLLITGGVLSYKLPWREQTVPPLKLLHPHMPQGLKPPTYAAARFT